MPMKENSVFPHFTTVIPFSSLSMETMPSGIRLTISPKSFASKTTEPGSLTSASMLL